MARLDRMSPRLQEHFLNMPCPKFDTAPWVTGPALAERRVALISTAGLHRRDDRPFSPGSLEYRRIPADTPPEELVMSHVSTNFDRTGFQQDWNVVFPLDRLREMAAAGVIGSVARDHYSFMGAIGDVHALDRPVGELAKTMQAEGVDTALLVPV